MPYAPTNLDLLMANYELSARTPDARRFVKSWADSQFWDDLWEHLGQLDRVPTPHSGQYRSAFQIERDMQIRGMIDALEVMDLTTQKRFLDTVQQRFLNPCEWPDDPNETLSLGLSVILGDIGRGGCMETLALMVEFGVNLNLSANAEILKFLGGPSAESLGMTNCAAALGNPSLLAHSGEQSIIDAAIFYAMIYAIHREQTGAEPDHRVQSLLEHHLPMLGPVHSCWQYLPLVTWGVEFAMIHDLDVRNSALIAPMGIDGLQIRTLFWNPPRGVVTREVMHQIAEIEAISPPEKVIASILAVNDWKQGREHQQFSIDYIKEHSELFFSMKLEPKNFHNARKLGLSAPFLMPHKDMGESTRESFLGMDLGL